MAKRLAADFGSFPSWAKDFRATVPFVEPAGGPRLGWLSDRFHNIWINENDTGHLVNCFVILLLDVFEHAYLMDYGAGAPDTSTPSWPRSTGAWPRAVS